MRRRRASRATLPLQSWRKGAVGVQGFMEASAAARP